LVEPDPPTVTEFTTVNLGLPDVSKVRIASVLAAVPPIIILLQVADVVFTFIVIPLPDKTTLSELVGTPLGLQLLASPQLVVEAPPSHVFWALAEFIPKNKRKSIKNTAEKHDRCRRENVRKMRFWGIVVFIILGLFI
jgi:hypothetical protein